MNDVTAPEKPSTSTFTELNVRQEKGKPHFIRLYDSVVKRLERQLADNPGSTGLLLGSIEVNENCTIAVEQFEPTTKLEDLIRARKSANTRRVVGYYRSYSRDSFALDPADRALFQRCFPKDSQLLLLVKPPKADVGTAMFFLGENGQLAAGRATVEFPFNLRELGAEEATAASAPAAAKNAVELLPAPKSRGGRLVWKFVTAGVVVIASVFGLSELRIFDRSGEQPQPKNPPVENAAPPPAAERPEVKPVTAPTTTKPDALPKPKPIAAGPVAQPATIAKNPVPALPAMPQPPSLQTVLPPPLPDSQPPANTERDSIPQAAAPAVPVSPKPVAPSLPYTPPNAIRQIAPLVPESVRRSIKEDVVVRVRVDVDATGKVTGATPMETGNPLVEALARAAVSSIKHWQFEPAHRGSDKVPGDVVLSFTFRK